MLIKGTNMYKIMLFSIKNMHYAKGIQTIGFRIKTLIHYGNVSVYLLYTL